jgi:hypothetical protein
MTLALLSALGVGMLVAVPGLRPVLHAIGGADLGHVALVALAVVLEVASCVSFVVIFRRFFDRVPRRAAHDLAWSEMGSGAVIPGGGIDGLALGGWLLHLAGMPARQIVRHSSALFFLTSATNVLALATAGLLLVLGVADGPHDGLRAGLPILAAVTATAAVLALPRLRRRAWLGPTRTRWLADVAAAEARQATSHIAVIHSTRLSMPSPSAHLEAPRGRAGPLLGSALEPPCAARRAGSGRRAWRGTPGSCRHARWIRDADAGERHCASEAEKSSAVATPIAR